MAEQTIIKMVIQFRRDTAENWEQHKDQVPAAGEPCFVLDQNILKIGDGVKTFAELEPINGAKVEVSADEKSIVLEDSVFKLMGFDSAKVGAQPRKAQNGSIEWVMPVDITSLEEAVTELKSDVSGLKTTVASLQEIITPSGEGATTLLSRVEGLEHKMDGTDEGSVDAKIAAKINEFANDMSSNGTIDTFKELVDYVANHGGEVATITSDIMTLQALVGDESVENQISNAIKSSGHITKDEAELTLLSKVEAKATLEHIKYEITSTPVGTLVDYGDKEIRVMVPKDAQFTKQSVGTGGDPNTYYMTFRTYAPSDDAVGYIEHLGDQVDAEILTNLVTDTHGRKYQSSWLGLAKYDETTDAWTYYGANSSVKKYIGWDYRIDWYNADGVMIESDGIRINLSNESCHNVIEPYYMSGVVKEVVFNGTLLDVVDGRVNITVEDTINVKGSDEIDVAEDGTLSIKSISWDKISQTEGEDVVFDGGGAAR